MQRCESYYHVTAKTEIVIQREFTRISFVSPNGGLFAISVMCVLEHDR